MSESMSKENVVSSFNRLSCQYTLQNIFNHLKNIHQLQIIRYSKKYQTLLNKTIKDYADESQKIIVEIFPAKNKDCKFINISKKK